MEEINKTKRSDVLFIDSKLVKIEEGFNTRNDYGDIEELSNSIIENGVRVPLRGYKEDEYYILTDGHRRFKAVNLALEKGIDIARIPFISEKKKSLEERIFDILVFNDGKQLTPLELGETYKKLTSYGYNATEISKKIGKTIKHVSDMIKVACSTKELKKLINDDLISASLVAEIKSKVKNDEEAEEIIKTVSTIKKEDAKNGNTKEKVTKKDVDGLLPEKEEQKNEVSKKSTYTEKEVRELLKEQLRVCSKVNNFSLNIKFKILQTKLVID